MLYARFNEYFNGLFYFARKALLVRRKRKHVDALDASQRKQGATLKVPTLHCQWRLQGIRAVNVAGSLAAHAGLRLHSLASSPARLPVTLRSITDERPVESLWPAPHYICRRMPNFLVSGSQLVQIGSSHGRGKLEPYQGIVRI